MTYQWLGSYLLEKTYNTTFMDLKFIAVTDILVDGPYTEAINIIIERDDN
jgi:hypothetical protein